MDDRGCGPDGTGCRRLGDLTIITSLLLFNALLGFWEEHEASNALDALKNSLALKARVLRSGKWEQVDARTLVPGDIVRLYLGDAVPADCKLIQGDYISIDQSALTGESLPVTKKSGEDAYAGSVAKQGEMVAVIAATGVNTFFGRTAKLVAGAGSVSHFQRAVMKIGNFLIILALVLVVILVASRLFDMRGHYDRFGVPAVLGMMAAVSVLGLAVTIIFGREDTED
jgi:H+-transporting ATPase